MSTLPYARPEQHRHLGDGVYANFDGYGIEIRVNDHRSPMVAYFEPGVVANLSAFLAEHQQAAQAHTRAHDRLQATVEEAAAAVTQERP